MSLRFVELFAGIGGFGLGFERAGMECVGRVEIDPYARKILKKQWPEVALYGDVKKITGKEFGPVDLICGGFPCQDLSAAGKGAGIGGERSGLFFEISRIATVCRPRWIVLENVPGLLSRDGEWMGAVLGTLSRIGYDAEWETISAKDFGAPHLRKRVWIVAYPNGNSKSIVPIHGKSVSSKLVESTSDPRREHGKKRNAEKLESKKKKWSSGSVLFKSACEGFRRQWELEPGVGRVANGVPNRSHRLRCLGNALVPQIAEYIGRVIVGRESQK